jgi:hypothetical protein
VVVHIHWFVPPLVIELNYRVLSGQEILSILFWAYPERFTRLHDAVIRVYDGAGNVIETHEHAGDFKEW